MTNFFKVTRSVRQGSPLSPLLIVLGAEILAQKIRQSSECRGIKLPQNVETKELNLPMTQLLYVTTSRL